MLSGLETMLIILIFLLILTQTVKIRIIYNQRFILVFNFTFLAFTLYPESKKRSKKRRKRSRAQAILRTLKHALSRTHVAINSFPCLTGETHDVGYVTYGVSKALGGVLAAYIVGSAASIEYDGDSEHTDYPLDLAFHISLYHLILTFAIYLKESNRSNAKARRRRSETTITPKTK